MNTEMEVHDLSGEEHIAASLATPLREDAFKKVLANLHVREELIIKEAFQVNIIPGVLR